ncbi:DUF3466 family protein [Pseudoalteromonas sp. MMG010]|uniref:DUF3466 family protein n=1 Tax=Pseudoalteromonas sp. MMG010 TaxID=2822685 RepID=UPI001B39F63A|nr:DUF3466 family protein [Pseudoalteromonas sp. MMG010]MBQ4832452.1 DUF3466 family protein [Pseudoalteromonas sp. MMG010]
MKYKLLAASIIATLSNSVTAATYELTELGTTEDAKHAYITDVSEGGHIIGVVTGIYNLPIDISYLDFADSLFTTSYSSAEANYELIDQEISFTLDDIQYNDAIYSNADAHSFMVSIISSLTSNFEYQKLGSLYGVNYDDGTVTEQVLFDEESPDFDGLTRSTTNLYNAVSRDGVKVGWGSAPYEKVEFTPEDEDDEEVWFTREFIERGIIIASNGDKVEIVPEFDDYGGTSRANDIVRTSDGYIVVGNVSTGIPDDRLENIEDNCDEEDEPLQACIESLNISSSSGVFDKRAVKWEFDTSFNITSTEILGLGLAITDDEDYAFTSTALAVNENGIAVGTSHVRYKDSDTRITMPVFYKDGEVVELLDQDDDWESGKALAINDNDVIVGYGARFDNSTYVEKFFYYDIATGNTVFPNDYFSSSSSYANDINNQGYIVGEGEVGLTDSTRNKEAFIYQIGEDEITNLNDLLPCYEDDGETEYRYTVAEAKVINDNNEIFGVATKTVEKTDSLGNIETDINGDIEYESIVVPVKLTPLENGSVENCVAVEAETFERSSASFHWFGLLLLPLVGLRRVFRF